ncbi:hypothetical protein CCY99_04370 [Helicobacter sp. 16-1353]|uniref:TRAP transporter small permease subunit n=1 Tax=Helicobacter sp. 16-1353 TaxID=2004996 RepID=UPI000DCC67BA|nr:TRAP transporter small permease subunit [Helicobacter sp. 16-1353]RAX54252.1 hypothetical protein CCY99_04370 [Helicobacter sp. 16-1353]
MQKVFLKISKILDSITKFFSYFCIAMLCILTLIVFLKAVLLQFGIASAIFDDLSMYFFSAFFLPAISYALLLDKHVRLDVVYVKYSKRQKLYFWIFVNLFFIIPFSAVISYFGFHFALQGFHIMESSPNGRIPYYFIFKGLIAFGFLLVILQSISEILKSIMALKGEKVDFIDEDITKEDLSMIGV